MSNACEDSVLAREIEALENRFTAHLQCLHNAAI